MMDVQMMVCEVSIIQIGHMEGAQNSIEPSWFMHDLMGDGELN